MGVRGGKQGGNEGRKFQVVGATDSSFCLFVFQSHKFAKRGLQVWLVISIPHCEKGDGV